MKSFFKSFFASLLAVVAGSGCLFISGIVLLVGALASVSMSSFGSSSEPVQIEQGTILKIDLSTISEIAQEDPFASFMGNSDAQPISLTDAVRAIDKARDDDRISAIYLNVEGISAGLASVDALRIALQRFKDSDKPIIAYADSYSQKAYYLSSVADQVLLNPEGNVELVGISSSTLMMKDALDKLGVEMQIFKVGTYKSAVEPYIQNKISDANREQIQAYISGLWNAITEGVAEARGISREAVETFADSGKAFGTAQEAVQAGLVDSLVYRSDVEGIMRQTLELGEEDSLPMLTLAQLATTLEGTDGSLSGGQIAVLYAEGEIKPEQISSYSPSVSINSKLIDELAEKAKDNDVKAVVLRINSPGGSAFLSEQIHEEVKRLAERKPVVVSMGDLAASGGYYIAAPAHYIVAEPNTLTGSIGIFGMIPNISGLTNKLGLGTEVVKTSKFAGMGGGSLFGLPMQAMTTEEKALIQGHVERGYRTFLSRVAEGRKMSLEAVDSVAQGRVWLGSKAKELGLVDEMGGLQVAIDKAAELADISDAYYVDYGSTKTDYFAELFASKSTSDFTARLRAFFLSSEERELMHQIGRATRSAGVQARLPYEIQAY